MEEVNLIFIHGFGGGPGDWDSMRRGLPGRHSCVDLSEIPISGQSTWPSFLTALEKSVDALLEREKPAALCGYSLGGRLALALAARMGQRISSLVLLSSGLGIEDSSERAARAALDKSLAAELRGDPDEFWRHWYEQPIFSSWRSLPEVQRSGWMKSRFRWENSRLARHLEVLGAASQPWMLKVLADELSIPVLYIAGEKDKKYVALGQRIQSSSRQVKFEVLSGVGHVLPLEAPDACAELISRFLKGDSNGNFY